VQGEVGIVEEFRAKWKLHQTSYCFLATVISPKGEPNFTEHERVREFEPLWVNPEEALKLLTLGQTTDYEERFIEERDHTLLAKALSLTPKL